MGGPALCCGHRAILLLGCGTVGRKCFYWAPVVYDCLHSVRFWHFCLVYWLDFAKAKNSIVMFSKPSHYDSLVFAICCRPRFFFFKPKSFWHNKMDIISDNYAYNRNNITDMSYTSESPPPPPPKNKQTKQKANKKTEFTLLIFFILEYNILYWIESWLIHTWRGN